MGKGEGGRLRKAHKATVVGESGGEGCLAANIFELNFSEIYDFTLTNNIHVNMMRSMYKIDRGGGSKVDYYRRNSRIYIFQ